MPASVSEIESLFSEAGSKYLLLLLSEADADCSKKLRGTQGLALRVLADLTAKGGRLDDALASWASQRPSRVTYQHLVLDKNDSAALTAIGVCWLPQIRLVRRRTTLFRSSVSVGETGSFLAADVGGRSLRSRSTNPVKLTDALSEIVDGLQLKGN